MTALGKVDRAPAPVVTAEYPVGDGTSTSTILAHAIFADGVRNVVAGRARWI